MALLKTNFTLVFAIIPFIVVMITAYFLGELPRGSIFTKLLDLIAEKDLDKMMMKSGVNKIFSRLKYQGIRLLLGALSGVLMYTLMQPQTVSSWIIVIGYGVGVYKFMYLILVLSYKSKISRLNRELPYLIKTIVFLCYLYPLTNAIEKSIKYAPDDFKDDLETLMNDIYDNPIDFRPYQKWIDKYEGKLKNLDLYLKMLYKMKTSSTSKDQAKLLQNISAEVSADVIRARKAKNNTVNNTVKYVGLLPSGYFVVALIVSFIAVLGVAMNF